MPWVLDELARAGDIDWSFDDRKALPRSFVRHSSVPDEELWPIRITRTGGKDDIPDYGAGPLGGTVVVSGRFRGLVESLEPGLHNFIPLQIMNAADGAVDEAHYLFKPAHFVDDGIIVSESDVSESAVAGISMLLRTTQQPRLMWRASSIAGRHLWSDRRLMDAVTVSDALYEAMKARGMTGYQALESRVAET